VPAHNNYWFLTAPTKHTVSAGIIRNADVLIIGGGIAGLNLLYQLVISGYVNTYLVEDSTVGYHASGRGGGHLMLRGHKLFSKMPGSDGAEYLQFIAENNRKLLNGLRNVRFDSDVRDCGGLRLAINDAEMSDLEQEARFIKQHRDLDCPLFDQAKVRTLLPNTGFIGGMFVPTEAILNPYKVVNGLRELIEQKGPRVLTNSCVTGVSENDDGSLTVSIRHKGTIRAKQVVYSNGAYIPELMPSLAKTLVSYRGQMVATDYLPDNTIQTFPHMGISCHDGNEYFRLYGGRLLVGGMRHAVRGQQVGIMNDGDFSPTVYDKLREFVGSALPVLGDVKYAYTWSGIMTSTPDGLPLIGALPNRRSQYIFGGFNNYGFGHALQGSILLKDIITKHEPPVKLFDPARFQCN
jgi:glycine/D-amino acid oxidase-like deaminating enzyme